MQIIPLARSASAPRVRLMPEEQIDGPFDGSRLRLSRDP